MKERFALPMDMGQAILNIKRMSHLKDFGNSAVAIQGGGLVVPKMDGSVQIRRAGRGGRKMTTTIAEGIHACAGLRDAAYLTCIDKVPGFRAPGTMIATGGTKGVAEKKAIKARGFALSAK